MSTPVYELYPVCMLSFTIKLQQNLNFVKINLVGKKNICMFRFMIKNEFFVDFLNIKFDKYFLLPPAQFNVYNSGSKNVAERLAPEGSMVYDQGPGEGDEAGGDR